jgi:hypothetical protein
MSASTWLDVPPVDWQRALGLKPALSTSEAKRVRQWLREHGWIRVATAAAEIWLDPVDDEGEFDLVWSLSLQAARCAQALLEPAGWEAYYRRPGHRVSGPWWRHDRLRRGHERATILEALQAEQDTHQAVH